MCQVFSGCIWGVCTHFVLFTCRADPQQAQRSCDLESGFSSGFTSGRSPGHKITHAHAHAHAHTRRLLGVVQGTKSHTHAHTHTRTHAHTHTHRLLASKYVMFLHQVAAEMEETGSKRLSPAIIWARLVLVRMYYSRSLLCTIVGLLCTIVGLFWARLVLVRMYYSRSLLHALAGLFYAH